MNKKSIIIICVTVIILIIGGVRMMLSFNESSTVTSFNVETYKDYLNDFSSDKILGNINDKKDVIEKTEHVWVEIYGERIKAKKPYKVSFDKNNKIWLVQGSLSPNTDGGVPYILIRESDGKVLAVWHDK